MAEYIEREKIWPALNVACAPYNRATAMAIESIPVADVRPVKRGIWITRPYMMGNTQFCSLCSENYGVKYNFCPNCGADMREPPKNENKKG